MTDHPATCLVATDLDRTMIYSAAALGGSGAETVCVEMYEGAPLSFMTARAAQLLRELTTAAVVVPTTTRTVEQFQRIRLPGEPFRYGITTNGGTILVDGTPDADWRRGVDTSVAETAASLAEVTAELSRRADPSWVLKQRVADDLFCYLVVDPSAMPDGIVDDLGVWCSERGWNISRQGRKIYAMPDAVCKSRAVAEVRRRLIEDGTLGSRSRVLAAGDGALDAEMLRSADAAIRPRHGELEALRWQMPGLTITESSGGTASEEILRWFSDNLHPAATHVR